MISTSKEFTALLTAARDDFGCALDVNSKRIKVTRPGYSGCVICSRSPSDWRAVRNAKAHLRRVLGVTL